MEVDEERRGWGEVFFFFFFFFFVAQETVGDVEKKRAVYLV